MALKIGDRGDRVKSLQLKLIKLGFLPGDSENTGPDGDFGRATEAAVLAFQKSEGLLADLPGPKRWAHSKRKLSQATSGPMPPGCSRPR